MAYQKLQVSSALAVIPSDFINIPNPSDSSISGTTDGTTGLTDTSATFTDGSVKIGDIVYDTSNSVVGRVTAIAATVLTLDNGNGVAVNLATGASYVVYKDTNNAAVLYVGVAGDLAVEMANSGLQPTQATFTAAANGYHPIQVNKVLATGTAATNIVALW
jgi:hypothetical protein